MDKTHLRYTQLILLFLAIASLLAGGIIVVNGIQSSGKEIKWSISPGGELLRTPLFNDNGSMYIWSYNNPSQSNKLYSISPQGKLYWTKEVYNIESAAVSSNGTIYCGGLLNSTDRIPSLLAIGSNGSMEWVSPFRNGSFYSVQLGSDGGIYTLFSTLYSEPYIGGTRIAKFGQNGTLLWYLSPGNNTSFDNLAFMANGTLISWTNDNHLNWIDANGSIIWRATILFPVDFSFIANDCIYGVLNWYNDELGYGGLYRCDLQGSVLWWYAPGIHVSFGNEVIQDVKGMLYFEGTLGNVTGSPRILYALDLNGTFHWKYQQVTISHPILHDGQIVIVNEEGIKALDDNGNVKWTFGGVGGWAIYGSNGQLYVIGQNTITMVGDSTSVLTTDGALIGVLLFSVGLAGLGITIVRIKKN